MVKKLTNEDIVERMYELVGDEYTKLDDVYINNQTKFPIKHETCGHEYEVIWNAFRNGNLCPKCGLNQQVLKKHLPMKMLLNVSIAWLMMSIVS